MYSNKFFYNEVTEEILDTNTPKYGDYFLFIDHDETDLSTPWVEVLECTEDGVVISSSVVHDYILRFEDGSMTFSQTLPNHI
jgi:hypothetical protein